MKTLILFLALTGAAYSQGFIAPFSQMRSGATAPPTPRPPDPTIPAPRIDTTGIVAWYPLNTNSNDTSWRANNMASTIGADWSYATQVSNGGGWFMHVNNPNGASFASIADNPSLSFAGSSWTVISWCRFADASGYKTTVNKWTGGTTKSFWMGTTSSGKWGILTSSTGSNTAEFTSDTSVFTNRWTLLVATYDAAADSIGISVSGGPLKKYAGGACFDDDAPLKIGGFGGGSASIDEVILLKRRMMDAEIVKLWDASRTPYYPGYPQMPRPNYLVSQFAVFDSLGTDSTLIGPGQYISYDAYGIPVQIGQRSYYYAKRGQTHAGDTTGRINAWMSTDGWATSTMTTIADTIGGDDRNVAGGYDSTSGRVVLFWDDATSDVCKYAISTDSGITFKAQRAIEARRAGAIVAYGGMLRVADTLYQSFFYDAAPYTAFLEISTDNGSSWHWKSNIDSSFDLTRPISESSLLYAGNGTLLCVARNGTFVGQTSPANMTQYISTDMGTSWAWLGYVNTKDAPTSAIEDVSPWLMAAGDTTYLIWNYRTGINPATPPSEMRVQSAYTGLIGPRRLAWSPTLTVYNSKVGNNGSDIGQPGLYFDQNRRLRATWYDGKSAALEPISVHPNIYITR